MKRQLAALCAVITAFTAFAGCTSGGGNGSDTTTGTSSSGASESLPQTSAPQGGQGATIKVLHHRTDREENFKGYANTFTSSHPDIKIEFQTFTDYSNEVPVLMNADNYGDVLMTPQSLKQVDLPNFFVPLGDAAELSNKYYWMSDYVVEGQGYAIPTAGTASGILYNKKVFEEAGIEELPRTPDEFVAALKQIAEKTDAIPYYTNYAAGWTISQWQSLVVSASGSPDYENNLLLNKEDLFSPGSPYDKVYHMLYDIYSDPTLVEEDHSTTDWEGSKPAFGQGKIGAMVLGSWAISQFAEQADNPDDVGFMPMPAEIDGKLYAQSAHDYGMSINKNSANIEAAKSFLYWFVDESGFAIDEGMIAPVKGTAFPSTLDAFNEMGVTLFESTPAPDELVGVFDRIAKESEVDPWGDASTNFKLKLAEAAFAGKGESEYEKITADVNAAWNKKRDEILK